MIVNNPKEIFSKCRKEDFMQLLQVANSYNDIDVNNLYNEYLQNNPALITLQDKWMKSLSTSPDYSVYGEDVYLNEAFVCWKVYSRRYLKLLDKFIYQNKMDVSKIKRVLDLGCGIGYTSIGLKSIFENSEILATNLSGTLQYSIDEHVFSNIEGCNVYDESKTFDLGDIDLIFASEFFEHQQKPVEFLNKLLITYKPKYFVFANTFTQPAIGHFKEYNNYGILYDGKQISKLFYKTLRNSGYEKVETGFFNGRPNIYKRINQNKLF